MRDLRRREFITLLGGAGGGMAARGGRKNNARSTGVGGPAPPELRGCVYLARLNVTSAVPLPADGVRTVYFISSPATVIGRFCSVPFQFGNELYSM